MYRAFEGRMLDGCLSQEVVARNQLTTSSARRYKTRVRFSPSSEIVMWISSLWSD